MKNIKRVLTPPANYGSTVCFQNKEKKPKVLI